MDTYLTIKEILTMFQELDCPKVPEECADEKAYVDALRDCYENGRVQFGTFQIGPHEVFDYLAERNRLIESGFMHHVWGLSGPSKVFGLKPREGTLPYSREAFGNCTPLDLDGFLARILFEGGAYRNLPAEESRWLGRACADAIVDGALEGPSIFLTSEVWCDFFMGVAWDVTLVAFVPSTRRLRILLATDSD